jgi:GAF domain-containing protein
MKEVICLEHVGPMRTWTKDEESFAYLISNTIAIILESQLEGVK